MPEILGLSGPTSRLDAVPRLQTARARSSDLAYLAGIAAGARPGRGSYPRKRLDRGEWTADDVRRWAVEQMAKHGAPAPQGQFRLL